MASNSLGDTVKVRDFQGGEEPRGETVSASRAVKNAECC